MKRGSRRMHAQNKARTKERVLYPLKILNRAAALVVARECVALSIINVKHCKELCNGEQVLDLLRQI